MKLVTQYVIFSLLLSPSFICSLILAMSTAIGATIFTFGLLRVAIFTTYDF
jgi:hypothetical protein